MNKKKLVCCICGCKIEGYGNNPQGAAWRNADGDIEFSEFGENDRCCDACDSAYVIPGRIYRVQTQRRKEK